MLISFLAALLLVMANTLVSVQKPDLTTQTAEASDVSGPVPVVFGRKDDGLPEQFEVVGRITLVSFSRRPCGVTYSSGTLRIELFQKIQNYPYRSVFVAVNCLEDKQNEKKYLNKVVRIQVSKLYPELGAVRDPLRFYFSFIENTINSNGVSFYCTNMGGQEILKSIETEAKTVK